MHVIDVRLTLPHSPSGDVIHPKIRKYISTFSFLFTSDKFSLVNKMNHFLHFEKSFKYSGAQERAQSTVTGCYRVILTKNVNVNV